MVNETRVQAGERMRMRKAWCAKARGERVARFRGYSVTALPRCLVYSW